MENEGCQLAYWHAELVMSFQFFTNHFKLHSNSFVECLVSVCLLFNFHSQPSSITPPPPLIHPLPGCPALATSQLLAMEIETPTLTCCWTIQPPPMMRTSQLATHGDGHGNSNLCQHPLWQQQLLLSPPSWMPALAMSWQWRWQDQPPPPMTKTRQFAMSWQQTSIHTSSHSLCLPCHVHHVTALNSIEPHFPLILTLPYHCSFK